MANEWMALRGRVVTMDATNQVLKDAIVYIQADKIIAIAPVKAKPPSGFESITPLLTRGTIYPGMIELHNHLSYNALGLWQVPKKYTNRDDWGRHPDYRKLISGPMQVLGRTAGYSEAIVRYVECKCMLGGVSTSQGISLASNTGIRRFYKGLMRNVEISESSDMPAAKGHIADVAAQDAEKFLQLLKKSSCLLLHLSEGSDQRAHAHFEALKLPNGEFAIHSALAGIHCVALNAADFKLMAQKQAAMVWSPLSNLLLYGQTANVKAAKEEGVLIALGSDWSPSGSKNLLMELKVAHSYSQLNNNLFTPMELVAMVTRNPAKILKWDQAVGSLESNKRADLIVLKGKSKDPYLQLIESKETDIQLLMIDGVRRLGTERLMPVDSGLEQYSIAGKPRLFDLRAQQADPAVGKLSLKTATERLVQGLSELKTLALALEQPAPVSSRAGDAPKKPTWFLVLEHEEPDDLSIRPRFNTQANAPQKISDIEQALLEADSVPLSSLLEPLTLDPLTVADDAQIKTTLSQQQNLPANIKHSILKAL